MSLHKLVSVIFSIQLVIALAQNVDLDTISSYSVYQYGETVKEKLDCDGPYTNEQKSLFLTNLKGNRVVFRDNILTIRVEKNEITLSGDFFQGFPKIQLDNHSYFVKIREGEEYTFDCEISNYCQDGFIDGNLVFLNCHISSEEYLIFDKISDLSKWWESIANVSKELADETATSIYNTIKGGELNGLQLGPSSASYAYEFWWVKNHILIMKKQK